MIIVTGGTGFIGSNILKGLEDKGYKNLVSVDWLGTGDKWKNISKRNLSHIVFPEDLDAFLKEHVDEIECVIHMGAISCTTETDVDLIVKTNIHLTSSLWKFCSDNDIRFIYASSAATYGSGEKGFNDSDSADYLNSLRPLNAYGWSKALFDRMVAENIRKETKLPRQYVGLKFFNVYGPNEYHKGSQQSVVAHIFPDALNNRPVKLFKSYNPSFADGEQLRDFVWVGDIVKVVLWFLENKKVNGLFNVGSGEPRSFNDLANATFSALGTSALISYIDMPENLQKKYQYFTKADITKLRSVGFTEPMTSLEDGIKNYVLDFLIKEDPYL